MSGDPTPNGITLLTRIDDVERSGGVLLEVARDRSFKNVVTRKTIRTSAGLNHSVKARVTGLKAYEQYYYRFATTLRGLRGRALPHRAAGGLAPDAALRVLLVPGLHARLLQRARGDGQARLRLRGLPRRLHLRRDLPLEAGHGRSATTTSGSPTRATRTSCARRSRSPTTGASTRCTARTSRCGRSRRSSRWS